MPSLTRVDTKKFPMDSQVIPKYKPEITAMQKSNLAVVVSPRLTGQSARQQYVCESALRNLGQLRQNRLGPCHYFQKYTVTPLAYIVPGAVVIAAILEGTRRYVIPNLANIAMAIPGAAASAAYSTASTLGPMGSAAVVGGLIVDNMTMQYARAIPNAIINGTVYIASKLAFLGIKGVGSIASNHYKRKEDVNEKTDQQLRALMVQNQIDYYRLAAMELQNLFKLAKKDPEAMLELKKTASILESKRQEIFSTFKETGFTVAESELILREMQQMIDLIKGFEFAFSPNDMSYNVKLFRALPAEAFKSGGIPFQYRGFLEAGKTPRMGICHQIKGALKATVAMAATAVAIPAIGSLLSSDYAGMLGEAAGYVAQGQLGENWQPVVAVTAATASAVVLAVTAVAQRTMKNSAKESSVHNQQVDNYNKQATTGLKALYDGIAAELKNESIAQEEGHKLLAKAGALSNQLKKYSVVHDEILHDLQGVVENAAKYGNFGGAAAPAA